MQNSAAQGLGNFSINTAPTTKPDESSQKAICKPHAYSLGERTLPYIYPPINCEEISETAIVINEFLKVYNEIKESNEVPEKQKISSGITYSNLAIKYNEALKKLYQLSVNLFHAAFIKENPRQTDILFWEDFVNSLNKIPSPSRELNLLVYLSDPKLSSSDRELLFSFI